LEAQFAADFGQAANLVEGKGDEFLPPKPGFTLMMRT